MINTVKKLQFFLFLLTIFLLPLLTFDKLLIRPLIVPATTFWTLTSILLFIYIIASKNGFRWSGGLVLIFLFTIYEIARDLTLTSIVRSLFGDARGPFLSVLTSVSLFIIYLCATQFSLDVGQRKKIISILSISISIVAFLAILQHFTKLPFFNPSVRGYATLPNPVELAGICLLLIGMIGYYINGTKNTYLYFIFLLILSFGAISTQSKIGIILLTGTLLFLFIRNVLLKEKKIVYIYLILISLSFLFYLIPVNDKYLKASKFERSELSQTAVASSMSERVELWKNATGIWLKNPFIGTGQADFPNIYTKFIKSKYYRSENKLIAFDVHNWILDILSKGGVLKLLLIVLAIIYFVRNSDFKDKLNNSIFFAFGIYSIFLFFNPSYLVSKVYFFTLLGLISINSNHYSEIKPQKILFIIGILFSVFYLTLNTYFGYLRLNAEIIGTRGVKATFNGNFDKGVTYSKKATEIFPYEPDYWQRLGWAYGMKYQFKNKSRQDMLDAIASYKKGLKLVPDDEAIKNRISNLNRELSK